MLAAVDPLPAAPGAEAGAAADAASGAGVDPWLGVMPKTEIQALQFLSEHPTYDGRGVVVAIFDTGVDPGASGLQTCPDGAPKVVDVIDCTGSGDVDTSTIVKADAEGYITGLHGARLRLNPDWAARNPTGEWRVGAKAAFELFPAGLKARMREERARARAEAQRAAEAAANAAADAAARAAAAAVAAAGGGGGGGAAALAAAAAAAEEHAARAKLLRELAAKAKPAEDPGPTVHAVLWHDGADWMCALDTTELHEHTLSFPPPAAGEAQGGAEGAPPSVPAKGALADFDPLPPYGSSRRHGTFSAADACNFGVQVYAGGDVLSLVVDAGSHGTHVAGIVAGHHPEDPALNGVAPGAQILSCKIGDSRLGSMETGVGLARALAAVLHHKAAVVNMSYGEAAAAPNAGRFVRLAEEVVHAAGVVFVASAGNAGPALSTVGAPGGTSAAVLGVGAYVSPALAAAGHSLRAGGLAGGGRQYNWSSRGPTADGDAGVAISAPGGAIAPVPQWTTSRRQLMNGTSMSSPCAAGGVALLLSAARAAGVAAPPARLRRAVENTARALGGGDAAAPLTYGRGLLQVAAAWEYLQRSEAEGVEAASPALRFEVSARRSDAPPGAVGRGIYLREPADACRRTTYAVEVKPALPRDADVVGERLAVEARLAVRCSAPWVAAPELLLLHHGGRALEVEVDAAALAPGRLHYAEVEFWDADAEWRGPLARLPVTVAKPIALGDLGGSPGAGGARLVAPATVSLGELRFAPGGEERRFVAVPEGATWAELRLRAGDYAGGGGGGAAAAEGDHARTFLVRATQLLPHCRYGDAEHRAAAALPPHGEHVAAFAVAPGGTLEVCVAQFWSSLGGGAALDVELSFHGVQVEAPPPLGGAKPGPPALALDAGGAARVLARAPLRRERVKPAAKLDTLRIALRPAAAELAPLPAGPRDALPEGRRPHGLLLTYKLAVADACKVTPSLPGISRYVYDGEMEAQMHMVFDANKRLLAVGDIYPAPVDLPRKGDYTIRVWLRHDDAALLERLRDAVLVVERALEPPVQLAVYGSAAAAVRGRPDEALTKERALAPGERLALFVAPPGDEPALPKDAAPGRVLTGTLALGLASAGAGGKPAPGGGAAIAFVVPPAKADAKAGADAKAAAAAADAAAEPPPPPGAALADALRDARVKFLADWKQKKEGEAEAEGGGGGGGRSAAPSEAGSAAATPTRRGGDSDAVAAALRDPPPPGGPGAGLTYDLLLAELKREHPGHLPLLLEPVRRLGRLAGAARGADALRRLVAAADEVAAAVDADAVAVYLGRKTPEEGPGAARRKKEAEERRAALAEAAAAKAGALLDLAAPPGAGPDPAALGAGAPAEPRPHPDPAGDAFEAAFRELQRWCDPAKEHALLCARREARAGRLAAALAALDAAAAGDDGAPARAAAEGRAALLAALGWRHWAALERQKLRQAFPAAYPLF